MSHPRNTEPQANGALARALRRRNPNWNDKTVHAERTNVIQLGVPGTGAGKRPDILIAPPRRQPVILETEFALHTRSIKTRPPGWGRAYTPPERTLKACCPLSCRRASR